MLDKLLSKKINSTFVVLVTSFFIRNSYVVEGTYREEFTGQVMYGEKKSWIQHLVYASETVNSLNVKYKITFNVRNNNCCPYLYLHHIGQERGYGTLNKCFEIRDNFGKTIVYDNRVTALDNGVYCIRKSNTINCKKEVNITTALTVNRFVSVGYACENSKKYLDMNFSIIFTEITPVCRQFPTDSSDLTFYNVYLFSVACKNYYPHYSEVNTMGWGKNDILNIIQRSAEYLANADNCYKNTLEIICRVVFPQCNHSTIVHPCKDMCVDGLTGYRQCDSVSSNVLDLVPVLRCTSFFYQNVSSDYDNSCTYTKVSCPNLNLKGVSITVNTGHSNVLLERSTNNIIMTAGYVATYKCEKELYVLTENGSRICGYDGKWSGAEPYCVINPVVIPLTCTILGVAMVIITIIIWVHFRLEISILCGALDHCKLFKRDNRIYTETLIYHAFVSYSEHDSNFVNNLLRKLESKNFELCLHDRNFLPGELIANNIFSAIDNSYRTIIVLSEKYLESEWCMFEFLLSHKKSISNSSFNIIIVLITDTEILLARNIPKLIRAYLRTRTYLLRSDRLFWNKLESILPKLPVRDQNRSRSEIIFVPTVDNTSM